MAMANNPYGYSMPYMPPMGMFPPNYPYSFPHGGEMIAGPSRLPDEFDLVDEEDFEE